MRYYINGMQTTEKLAKTLTEENYIEQGGDPVEFEAVWNNREASEEARDMLNEWSGYTLEIMGGV